jgi:hypothetical protein
MSTLAPRILLALGACVLSLPSPAVALPQTDAPERIDSMIGFIFDPRHPWNVSEENFQRFKDMGGRVVRLPLRWSSIEPVRGSWYWGELDAAIARARALELEIIGILGNGPVAPAWATGFRTVDARPYLGEWMQYVHNAVERYGDDIDVWEIGNEPFTTHGQMVPFDQYALFLRASYRMAKAIDPGCTVIHGGVRYQTDTWKVVSYILAPGAGRYTDGLNFHTLYRSSTQPEDQQFAQALESWSALADQWNVNPDLYLTESAWASAEDGDSPWGYVDEDLHAAYSVRTLIIGLAHERLKTVVNAWLINDSYAWGYWDDTGFIREDGSEKAAWFATRFAYETLSGLRFVDDSSRPGIEKYVFRGPRRQVTVLWSTGSAPLTTRWAGRSPTPRFFDQVGEEVFPPTEDGRYLLTVDRRPLFAIEEP